MSKFYDELNDRHLDFIARQKIFFVATAPLAGDGSINLSPKGYDSIRVAGPKEIAWIDLGGSGIETLAHLKENARITLMFCAFEGSANIMRIYGRGEAIPMDHPEFEAELELFPAFDRARSIIRIRIDRVQDSCGWGVPFYKFEGEREQLKRSVDHKPLDEWRAHRYRSNATSIDGLPGLVPAGGEGSDASK